MAGFGERDGEGDLGWNFHQNFSDSLGVWTPWARIELPSEPSSLSGVLLGVCYSNKKWLNASEEIMVHTYLRFKRVFDCVKHYMPTI